MPESPSLLMTVFAFVLVLGPLVVVHELGHYLVARLFKVKIDAFSVGFGKELAGRTDKHGTRWKLSAVPLGGYVQFAGDTNAASMPAGDIDELSPREREVMFHAKPLWQRFLIVAAGPVTNLLFAVAVFAAFNMAFGKTVVEPDVVGFAEASDARAAGLRMGDRITAIEGTAVDTYFEILEQVAYFPGRTIAVNVERDGRDLVIPVKLTPKMVRDQFGNEARIADLGVDFTAPVVSEFAGESPGKRAGIKAGDRILAVGGTPVTSFEGVRRLIQPQPGKTVSITLLRDGGERVIAVKLGAVPMLDEQGRQVLGGQLGIAGGKVEQVGFGEAVELGAERSIDVMRMMVTGIAQIFTGERLVRELGGPIKIAKYSGEQFSLGWADFVYFVALISINLAFINLLPIPGLDGGHLAFYAAEAVRRKPLGQRSQEWAFRTGLALVLALMLFVTINDLVSLPIFGS